MIQAERDFSFILFGASGHLAKVKIFPALYVLALKKRYPKNYAVVGYARTEMTEDAFRTLVEQSVRTDMGEVNEAVLKDFLSHVHYQSGQYDKLEDFKKLEAKLKELEKPMSKPVRSAYFSIPPTVFESVVDMLCESNVHTKNGDFRCIVEKPVGHDMASFKNIMKKLNECFSHEELFILDHYLGKEAVRNMYYLRQANPVIEQLLKASLITQVQITGAESAGLENRAGYFDAVGTLRDMVQSHLLIVGALLTMRTMSEETAMKAARLEALEKFYMPPVPNLSDVIVQGQYTAGTIGKQKVSGYQGEEGVSKHSRTPTYVALKLMTRSGRFEGIPFFLRTGKRMQTALGKDTRVSIEFQDAPAMLGKPGSNRNRLDIILQGEAGMKLTLQTKLGGSEPTFRPLILEDPLVCMGDCLPEHSLLLLEAVNGSHQWFLDEKEVEASWRLIDPLQQYLDDSKTPLAEYAAGSAGPKEAEELIEKNGFKWF